MIIAYLYFLSVRIFIPYCLIVLFVLSLSSLSAQGKEHTLSGIILNSDSSEVLPYVNVAIVSLGRGDVSDRSGFFYIDKLRTGTYELTISSIGFLKAHVKIDLQSNKTLKIRLKPLTTHLNELIVTSQRIKNNSSSSIIKRDAIDHVQPSSFSDILELLPGGISYTNSLVNMNLASFREAGGGTSNSSLGTAFVIDGMQMSNDAQMQTVPGAVGSNYMYNRNNTTGKGIDMRMISTDDIESVEIITDIASVEYGDATNALVRIHRIFSKTPLNIRMKLDPRGKLLSLGKGININTHHTVNGNFSLLNHNPDPRSNTVSYSRLMSSLRYKFSDIKSKNPILIKSSLDYVGSFDENKKDSEVDLDSDTYKYRYQQYRFSGEFYWYNNTSLWFRKLFYSISSSYTHERSQINKSVSSGSLRPMPVDFNEGVKEGFFLPSSYQSALEIDGKPLSVNSKIVGNIEFSTYNFHHKTILGSEYRHAKNYGKGRLENISTPVFPSFSSSMARRPVDIPALNKLSFFYSDLINIDVHTHKLSLFCGFRANTMLAIDNKYSIANKFYIDKRFKFIWKLPSFNISGDKYKLNFTASYANNIRLPSLTHLYPEKLYFNKLQLNFYSNKEYLSKLSFKTSIFDPTNFNISPSRNIKKQISLDLSINKMNLNVQYFRETMSSAYKSINKFFINTYTKYYASSVDVRSLTQQAALSDFSSEDKSYFETYGFIDNAGLTKKQGVEYALNLGFISPIYSRVSINGAWYKTKYDLSVAESRSPSVVLNGNVYPYIGIYLWDEGKTYQRFNTTVRIDTQITSLGLVFTSAIQALWFTKSKRNYNNAMPDYYYNLDGQKFSYSSKDTEDPTLLWMYKKNSPLSFVADKIPLAADINLKITKFISSKASLSFYVNSLLQYRPSYYSKYNFKVERQSFPRFGMELSLKI